MMWFNKHHPNAVYLDQRPECEPDIIGDFRKLKDFADSSLKLIVFDPPHLFENKNGKLHTSDLHRRFGALRADTWRCDLKKAFTEFFRVLEPNGVLILKWCDATMSSHEIIKLSPVEPLFYQISSVRHKKNSKSGSAEIRTLWFCFMKIEAGPRG